MRSLRSLLLALLVLALAAPLAAAQSQAPVIKLPGGGQIKVTLPKPKPAKGKAKKRNAARTSTVQVGIADEKATMFSDPRFLELGLKTARRSVAWDTFEYDWQIAEVDDWLTQARIAGVRPLITFNRSRIDSKRHVIPTRAQWLAGFTEFRRRYPWVTDFVATNESNHTPPTVKKPKLAARYYLDMRRACRTCRIAAATINERPEKKYLEGWIRRFVKAARHRPKFWALHNYYGANHFNLNGTKRFLKATRKGQVWVTEVGGLVARRSADFAGKLDMPEGLGHAQRVTRFIFDRILTVNRRMKRVYLYHWDPAGPTDTWDSALVSPEGLARGSLAVVKSKLAATKRKANRPR